MRLLKEEDANKKRILSMLALSLAFALLCTSAHFYHTRSLARTVAVLPYGLRYYCYLTVSVTAATLSFALPLLPYRSRFPARANGSGFKQMKKDPIFLIKKPK
ncbi:hypothetical protein [Methanimicrococcus blatticola]|uniref:hypothetical protein n=1 Tax=Methanimicrococcus blatticola TaxID=91560 RepID=UPI00105F4185|nr:hypothetical protein [Methanimicrococcus blatticola]MBZ3936403.1 hypothetical protein [Methanimicrococcus blatticola]MCC2509565.1 hypothetical protein [Methanimicrococcus blatticola]